ncbi:ATP-binding protein [Plebeiibacterium sediminum]|uniref:histidine kinase n=1 Tax=Plebeiibacterium sediminum TaxID=2992112 RepID=A0AAE3M1H9_9BACT|nr:ATP-binding protein [Plebeiobacterium sediminum]MCW3785075.1 ATP-binding protein [Plebeiobacterium sediminum]
MKFSSKLIVWFSVLSIYVASLSTWINWSYFSSKGEAQQLSVDINSTYLNILKLKNISNNFFTLETRSNNYFKTTHSPFLIESNNQNILLNNEIDNLLDQYKRSEHINTPLLQIKQNLYKRDSIFKTLTTLATERGFKDFGLIGQMRFHAHQLEKNRHINKEALLSLRRREKDYFLRHEKQYISTFDSIYNTLAKNLTTKTNQLTKDHLEGYQQCFNKIVTIDDKLGLYDNSGLKENLDQLDELLEERVTSLIEFVKINNTKKIIQLRKTLFFIIAFAILICFFISNILSSQITKPLTKLTYFIESIILNDFKSLPKINLIKGTRETNILYREFSQMIEDLKSHEKERENLITQLTYSEKKYRNMAQKLPLSIFETDKRGTLVYVNKMWENSFGYSKSEAEYQLNIFKITAKNKNKKNEVIAHKKDASWFPGLLYMDKVLINGEHKGWRGVIVDISERYEYNKLLKEERRKAKESDRLKTAFLANISHEIRTPLNAIMGFSTLLKNKNFTEDEKQRYYDVIVKSSKDLLSSFDDIISVSRIETDNNPPQLQITNLKELEENILNTAKKQTQNLNKNHLKIYYHKGNENYISDIIIDKNKVTEILTRLSENAIKFTETGTIEIGHTLLKTRIIFFVKDSGIGIPEEKHQIIFDPFRQVDETNTKTTGGTGLGLSICKGLVDKMNGTIWVESMSQKGSGFFFSINFTIPQSQSSGIMNFNRSHKMSKQIFS